MGLAGRKQKQRIPADPRNLGWADDAARFGQSYLSKFGWDSSQGLGSSGDGMKSHLKVSQKLDMLGIGAAHQRDPHGIAWKQNKDFEALLKRLNSNSQVDASVDTVTGNFTRATEEERDTTATQDQEAERTSDSEEKPSKEKKRKRKEVDEDDDEDSKKRRKKEKREKKEKRRNIEASEKSTADGGESKETSDASPSATVLEASRLAKSEVTEPASQPKIKGRPMAHRARIQAAKRLANKSAAAISEILGIAPTPTSSSALPSSSATPSGSLTPIDSDLPLEKITTSTKSVADYFKEKLGAKSSGAATPAKNTDSDSAGYDLPRGGLGSSRAFSSSTPADESDHPRVGIGKSGNVFASFFTSASMSHTTVLQMASAATKAVMAEPEPAQEHEDKLDSESPAADEELTEKQRRKAQRKEEKQKKREAAIEVGGDVSDGEKKRRKELKKDKERANQVDTSDDTQKPEKRKKRRKSTTEGPSDSADPASDAKPSKKSKEDRKERPEKQ
ncbi:hypothetical protein HYDPIDRAFT_166848 [Hydnomerulius pinastri MD-312]|nr:hypothetical protein HYDPIDRAFT_166848 [Hydnomerulius pinastri MD-312]